MISKDLALLDESLKDEAWMIRVISHYNSVAKPLVDSEKSREALTFLFGTQDMSQVRKMFTDPAESGLSFLPLAVLEKYRGVFSGEIEEAGIEIHVKATDPTAFNERQRDRDLLNNRKVIEALTSRDQQAIGNPPYKVADDKGEDGKGLYAGNVEKFDEMGLREDSVEDVAYFFQYWHRLDYERVAEEPIATYIKSNGIEEMLPMMVDDAMAKKAVTYRAYVNTRTGAIELKYVDPDRVYVVKGKRRDYKDAPCILIGDPVTVQEFINIMGDDFDREADMPDLLNAVNAAGTLGVAYSGVREDGCMCAGNEDGAVVEMEQFMHEKIMLWYIEFKTNNATAYKATKKNSHGNPARRPTPLSREVSPNSIYEKEVYHNQYTYKAYYIGGAPDKLYRAGKLSYQEVEGAEDEYSSGSIIIYKEPGQTFVEMAIPWITLFQKSKEKWEFEINMVKGDGRSYSFDSLLQIAESLYPSTQGPEGRPADKLTAIMQVIKMFTDSRNEIHTIPEIDGQPVGGGGGSSYKIERGFSNVIPQLQSTMQYCLEMLDFIAGVSQERSVYDPNPRDAAKLQGSVTSYSKKATRYLPRMIQSALSGMGQKVLYFVGDIIAFGDKATLAYKHLVRSLGDSTMESLETLKKVSLHRYSIFVEAIGMLQERQRIRDASWIALNNKEITTEQWWLIDSIRSPKRAVQILAFEKQRSDRMRQNQFMQEKQVEDQLDEKKFQRQFKLKQLEIQGRVLERDTQGRWLDQAYQNQSQTELTVEDKKKERDVSRIAAKTEANIQEMQAENNLAAQAPLV